jgi:excinuclease ABC subunit A
MYVVDMSDWVIDIGPGAGDEGGEIVVCGQPVEIIKNRNSKTGTFLRKHIES